MKQMTTVGTKHHRMQSIAFAVSETTDFLLALWATHCTDVLIDSKFKNLCIETRKTVLKFYFVRLCGYNFYM